MKHIIEAVKLIFPLPLLRQVLLSLSVRSNLW